MTMYLRRHGGAGAVPVHPAGVDDDPVQPARPLQRHPLQEVPLAALQRQLVDLDHGSLILHGDSVLVSTLEPAFMVHGYKVFWHIRSVFGWSQSEIHIVASNPDIRSEGEPSVPVHFTTHSST